MRRDRLITTALAAIAASFGDAALAEPPLGVSLTHPGQSNVSQRIVLGLDKSTIVELERPAADVVITNPEIADATVQTANRIVLRGIAIGATNAFIHDRDGNQLLNLEISVAPDLGELHDLIRRHVPDSRVQVEAVNESVLVTGYVESLSQSDRVRQLVAAYIGDEENVVNMVEIGAKDQVLLQVKIVEMQRSVIKQLGFDLSGVTNFGELASNTIGDALIPGAGGTLTTLLDADGNPVQAIIPTEPFERTLSLGSTPGFSVNGAPLGGLDTSFSTSNFVTGSPDGILQAQGTGGITALEQVGLARTLAEPNLVAISGESANFLAGGEFPVPAAQGVDGTITVEFQPFGVGVGFTPVVLSEGRISLRLSTEVSDISTVGSFTGPPAVTIAPDGSLIPAPGLTIPAIVTRRAETTIELPSGGSMMIAGLIQSDTAQAIDKIPALGDIPVLGTLFRSRDFRNEETELVIIVTPYLVDSANPNDFRTPADGFVNPSDRKTILFGKLNEMYAAPGGDADAEDYQAPVGFIEE